MAGTERDGVRRPEKMRRRPAFSSRVAAVFCVSLTFLALTLSGLAVYVAPRGRIANAIDWSLAGLDRQGWESVHASAGLLFVAVAVWHLLEHASIWRNLLFGTPTRGGHLAEAALALLVVGVVVMTAVNDWPPASWINDLKLLFRSGALTGS